MSSRLDRMVNALSWVFVATWIALIVSGLALAASAVAVAFAHRHAPPWLTALAFGVCAVLMIGYGAGVLHLEWGYRPDDD